jgi:hypothetical protein
LSVVLLLLPVLAIAALLAFVPRRDEVPDMRIVSHITHNEEEPRLR